MRSKLTKDDINRSLQQDGRGITLTGEYLGALVKTTFECGRGHQWFTTPNRVRLGRECRECYISDQTLTKDNINKTLSSRGITLLGEYSGSASRATFVCEEGHRWSTTTASVVHGKGCPSCANHGFDSSKQAWVYILKFDTFIKFGITNTINSRLRTHKRANGDFELAYSYLCDGKEAIQWEKSIKELFGGRFVSKEQCPDGYTETLPVHLLETLKTHTRFL
jgi:hypothetical protein